MDTKRSLEKLCQVLERQYPASNEFKDRMRRVIEPLYRHTLSADELTQVCRTMRTAYLRHVERESGVLPVRDRLKDIRQHLIEIETARGGLLEGIEVLVAQSSDVKGTARLVRLNSVNAKMLLNRDALARFLRFDDCKETLH
jgi:septation ring formation regulator EzrA